MIVSDDEYLDFSRVPESRGIPPILRYAGIVGIIMIFAIGASVCLLSGYGHKWPAAQSTRIHLPAFHEQN
jgi:hypothetical protein